VVAEAVLDRLDARRHGVAVDFEFVRCGFDLLACTEVGAQSFAGSLSVILGVVERREVDVNVGETEHAVTQERLDRRDVGEPRERRRVGVAEGYAQCGLRLTVRNAPAVEPLAGLAKGEPDGCAG